MWTGCERGSAQIKALMCQCGEAAEAGKHKGRGQCIKVSQRHQKWFHTRAYQSLRCSCLLCRIREYFFSFPIMRNISATEQETLPLDLSHAKKQKNKKKTPARHSHAVWPGRYESSSLMQQIKRWTLKFILQHPCKLFPIYSLHERGPSLTGKFHES